MPDFRDAPLFWRTQTDGKDLYLSNDIEPMLYSIPQTCTALGLSRSKTYELISEGRLLAVNIGRRRLVRVDSVKALAQGEAA